MPELPAPVTDDCQGRIHPMANEGFRLFNQGEYWHAHEALETAWLEETGEIRHLYRGILQIAVVYLHVKRGNYPGALKVYRRSHRWLRPFPAICRGIEVDKLRQDLEKVISEVRRLGPERMAEFDRSLLKPVVWQEED